MLFGKKILTAVLKITNGHFTTNTTGWTAIDATLASVAGGKTTNCLEITNTGAPQGCAHQALGLTIGKRYRLVFWHKNGTAGGGVAKLSSVAGGTGTVWYNSGTLDDADWAVGGVDFTAAANIVYLNFLAAADIAETDLWDSVEVFEITDVSMTPLEFGEGKAKKVRGRDLHFYYKGTSGFDRTVKIYGSINDADFFDLGLTFANGNALYSPLLSALYVDISAGEVGSADVWMMGRD